MKLGSENIAALKVGAVPVSKVYLGEQVVLAGASPSASPSSSPSSSRSASPSSSPSASPSHSPSTSPSSSPSSSISSSPSSSPSAFVPEQFSLQHVGGIGGNFAGEPQGLGFDVATQMIYAMSNNSSVRQVKKINLAGATLATSSDQGGSTLSIQDGCVKDSKVYVPRTNPGVEGFLQRFDLNLNYETQFAFPSGVQYATAVAFAHGYWWVSCNSDSTLYQISADFTTIVKEHDIATGNSYSVSPHYSGLAWYGDYLFGTEHLINTDLDIWHWDAATQTLSLVQEIDTTGLDLYNGLAIDEGNSKLYASSRGLSDDCQVYNIITL